MMMMMITTATATTTTTEVIFVVENTYVRAHQKTTRVPWAPFVEISAHVDKIIDSRVPRRCS